MNTIEQSIVDFRDKMIADELGVTVNDLRGAFGMSKDPAYARGFNTEGDVLTQTIDGRDLNEIWAEFQETLLAWNSGRDALIGALTFNVTQPIEDVPQVSLDDFEEASEFGEPRGVRGADYFSMGYDFKWYDVAARFTWKYLAEATASQVESVNNIILEADNRLVFGRVMRAIFNNVNRTTNIRGQNFNVYPFYNADGTVPPAFGPYTFSGSENHYITSGAATVDGGDLDAMALKISQKGYGKLQGSQMILLVNPTQLATIRTFRVATGSSYDFIPAAGGAPWLLPTNTGGVVFPQGGSIPSQVNGLPVAGAYGPWLVIENDYIPSGYMVGIATGGQMQATNPVGIREHQNPALRGLRLVKGRTADYPLIDSFYNRGFGTGIRHRGAGVVMQVTVAGSYTIPAAYA
jgi:hypothetical protein